MEDEVRSLFLVASFDDGSHCVAIYEIEIVGGGKGAKFIGPPVKGFTFTEKRVHSHVGCDILGERILLMASAIPLGERTVIPLPPLVFDTHARKFIDVPNPKSEKSFPRVMAVGGSFFVLGADTMCFGLPIKSPSFERFDPLSQAWDVLPDYRVPEYTSMGVVGYAVVVNSILISVVDLCYGSTTQFFCYKVGSSMEKWKEVEKENKDFSYRAIRGKAEYVDGFVYSFVEDVLLIAYHVTFSAAADDIDGIIQSISAHRLIYGLGYLHEQLYTSCFAYLGNRKFCLARTDLFRGSSQLVQYVTIVILEVPSDSMDAIILSSDDVPLPLNTEDLGQANLVSLLCLDLP